MTALPLEIEALDAWYGGARILTEISLSVGAGEVVALLGRNGAGKTTTLRAVFGLVPRRRGTVRVLGRDLGALPPHRIARLGLGYVPEDRRLFGGLTARENLEVGRQPPRPGLEPWTPDRLFALFPGLEAVGRTPAGRLSGGEQRMLAIARTLMGNPLALLLDEPSEGLAPRVIDAIAGVIRTLKAEGVAILLAEQSLTLAAAVADRACVIEKGEIRHRAAMADLARDGDAGRSWLSV